MDKREQAQLAAQLHGALSEHMAGIARLVFIMSGRSVDPASLVEAMERDFRRELTRAKTQASIYDTVELEERKKIARSVVAAIRLEVTGRG